MPAVRANTKPRGLGIGETARRSGCNIETVRYYERIGLLPEPPRSAGGHRLYGGDAVRRLGFIRRARQLGFAVDDIRSLLRLVDGKAVSCAKVLTVVDRQREDVRRRLADLKRIQSVLSEMAATCDGGDVPDCPIIDALFENRRAGSIR
jgi:MerR family mercuric resistance operon transcriptional regulator